MDDRQFRQILDCLGLSWSGYRKVRGGVKKRLRRHMQALGYRNVEDYLREVRLNPVLRREMDRLMTVSISRFFRDRKVWDAMESHIIPYLAQRWSNGISLWSAGCAMGQETYSFKGVWKRMEDKEWRLPELRIVATDLDPGLLERARAGLYGASSLRGVSAEWRDVCFERIEADRYRIRDELRSGIEWVVHDLVRDVIDGTFQLLFLRNSVLTYQRDPVRTEVLKKVVSHLEGGGVLVIGSHEHLPHAGERLCPFPSCRCVFIKPGGDGPSA